MPVEAAEEDRMQVARRPHVLRAIEHMRQRVRVFAGDVAEGDPGKAGGKLHRQPRADLKSHCRRPCPHAYVPLMPGTLPEPFAAWFAARGWSPRPHQMAMLDAARAGDSVLLIAPTGGARRWPDYVTWHIFAPR